MLDLSRVLAGPFCAQVLGDLGADVIKVEQPGTGDPVRGFTPPSVGGVSTYYLSTNRNRRSMLADLHVPEDRAVVAELARGADVVIENFLPHQVEAFGLEALRQSLPSVVWVSIRPASSGGPLAALPAFDLLAQARSGLMGVTGSVDSGPMKVGSPVADVLAGLYGAVAAVAGLHQRGRLGSASHFEVPLFEAALSALVNQGQSYLATGVVPGLLGNDHPSIAPYGPVPTADGIVMVAVGTDRQFTAFCGVLGRPELAEDPEFSTNAKRVEHRARLAQLLAEHFATAPTSHWLEVLAAGAIPCAPVNDVAQALAEPQVQETGLLQRINTPAGEVPVVGSPLLVDGRRLMVRTSPPSLGQDDDAIRGALGAR